MKNTPCEIEVFLHYATRRDAHPRIGSPAVADAVKRFHDDGIFDCHKLTDRGIAWLTLLMSVPYPRRAWVDQSGNVIEIEKEQPHV